MKDERLPDRLEQRTGRGVPVHLGGIQRAEQLQQLGRGAVPRTVVVQLVEQVVSPEHIPEEGPAGSGLVPTGQAEQQ